MNGEYRLATPTSTTARVARTPMPHGASGDTAPREARHLAFAPRSLRLRHKSRASHARPLCLWPPSARTQWRQGGSCSSTQPDDRVATNTIARSSAWRATPLSPTHSRLAVVAEAKSDGGRGLRVAWLPRSSAQSEHCLCRRVVTSPRGKASAPAVSTRVSPCRELVPAGGRSHHRRRTTAARLLQSAGRRQGRGAGLLSGKP
jgi:hypothetical protein